MEIRIENIKKAYGKHRVLKDISIKAVSGECIGILGANGCGKSTLLSILSGSQKADGGRFLLDGKNLLENPKLRNKAIGYVPQGTPLIEELSAYDNLYLWYEKPDLKKELESGTLKMLGIDEFLHVKVSKMSGGMKKRLSIGCALSNHPGVLLLDEPMSALDLKCKKTIQDYLKEYKRLGGIVILVTHDLLELEICDKYYIIKDGSAVSFDYSGDTDELVNNLS